MFSMPISNRKLSEMDFGQVLRIVKWRLMTKNWSKTDLVEAYVKIQPSPIKPSLKRFSRKTFIGSSHQSAKKVSQNIALALAKRTGQDKKCVDLLPSMQEFLEMQENPPPSAPQSFILSLEC